MVSSRTAIALGFAGGSIALSVLLYLYTGSLLFFLIVPFVPFLFSNRNEESETDSRPLLECPRCEFSTRNPEFEYCPRDGNRLYKQ